VKEFAKTQQQADVGGQLQLVHAVQVPVQQQAMQAQYNLLERGWDITWCLAGHVKC